MKYINLNRESVEAELWVTQTAASLGDKARAQWALRAVLLALRDSLSIVEAARFARRLPTLIRGIYTEHWQIRPWPSPVTRTEFLDRVAEGLAGSTLNSEAAVSAVFQTVDQILGGVPELEGFREAARTDKTPDRMAHEIRAAEERAALDGAPIPATPEPDDSLFAGSVERLEEWVTDLMLQSGWTSREQALAALCVVLQVLRDRVTVPQALRLGSRLPPAVRGFYYENWDPEKAPDDRDFMHSVENRVGADAEFRPGEATVAVLHLLSSKVKDGEMRDVRTSRRFNTARSRLRRTRSRTTGKR